MLNLIAEIYQDDERYAQLVKSSRAAFETRLNWDAWALSMQKIIAELLGRPVVQNFKEQSVATHKFH